MPCIICSDGKGLCISTHAYPNSGSLSHRATRSKSGTSTSRVTDTILRGMGFSTVGGGFKVKVRLIKPQESAQLSQPMVARQCVWWWFLFRVPSSPVTLVLITHTTKTSIIKYDDVMMNTNPTVIWLQARDYLKKGCWRALQLPVWQPVHGRMKNSLGR